MKNHILQDKREKFQQNFRKQTLEQIFQIKRFQKLSIQEITDQETLNLKKLFEQNFKFIKKAQSIIHEIYKNEDSIIELMKSDFLENIASNIIQQNLNLPTILILRILVKIVEYAQQTQQRWILLQFKTKSFLDCIEKIEDCCELQIFLKYLS